MLTAVLTANDIVEVFALPATVTYGGVLTADQNKLSMV
jgi:hypothetical protein